MTSTNVFSKWKESLGFFKKESLKLFVLVGLNNAKRSTVIFFSKFWWLLLLVFTSFVGVMISFLGKNFISILMMNKAAMVGAPVVIAPPTAISILLGFSSFVVLSISFSLLIFVPYLIVRPSIEAKDSFYFKKHFKRIWGFLFLMFFLMIPSYFLIYSVVGAKVVAESTAFKFFGGLWGIISALAIFFFLDSQKKLSSVFVSIFKALKAFVYFLPVFVFLSFVLFFFNSLSSFLFPLIKLIFIKGTFAYIALGVIIGIFYLVFAFAVSFFNLSLIVNYYTMLKHKYYKLFYN